MTTTTRPVFEQRRIAGTPYGFSATRIRDLGAAEYTLVAIAADKSGSVSPHATEIERTIGQIVASAQLSPRADNLMLRVCVFDDTLTEVHGFAPLAACSSRDYRGTIANGGTTALYDAAHNAIAAVSGYADELVAHDFAVNAIVFVVTDGLDNASKASRDSVGAALAAARSRGRLESLTAILVGVGVDDATTGAALAALQRDAGFAQYVELAQADAATLAKLAAFVSRSIAVQSRALGTGAAGHTVGF
jgi:hypothetical protein